MAAGGMLALVLVLAVVGASGERGDLWAVLVAGSNGWYNYRHQADVCHAYQILHQHGVPDDHIIVMMYDDIANNEENPTPGVIINRPNGTNVYANMLKDYTGDDVTPENFLKVLRGDAEGMAGIGSGKVVGSGPNDRIFVNMVDHGAPGIFAFPNDYLNATDLINTILGMHRDQKFAEMVMYVESCESGSLFKNVLPHDAKIYALSASGPHQHSYACYLDEERETYLGDVFSVKWMEDTDRENLHQETLKQQYKLVRKATTTSSVRHWGQIHLDRQHLSKFLGGKSINFGHRGEHLQTNNHKFTLGHKGEHLERNSPKYTLGHLGTKSQQKRKHKKLGHDDPCLDSAVAAPDVPVAILKGRHRRAKDPATRKMIKEELKHIFEMRAHVKTVMGQLVNHVTGNSSDMAALVAGRDGPHDITRWDCYTSAVRAFHDHCYDLAKNPWALRVLQPLVNMCEHGYTAQEFAAAAATVCTHAPVYGIV